MGFPEAWDGDKYRELYCPSKNIPKWLDGYFLCQLSASYGNSSAPPGQRLNHMIDAIGAVGSFHISNGQVCQILTIFFFHLIREKLMINWENEMNDRCRRRESSIWCFRSFFFFLDDWFSIILLYLKYRWNLFYIEIKNIHFLNWIF